VVGGHSGGADAPLRGYSGASQRTCCCLQGRLFFARLALWRRWFATIGTKRCRKKSASLGRAGIFGNRGSPPIIRCLPFPSVAKTSYCVKCAFSPIVQIGGVNITASAGR